MAGTGDDATAGVSDSAGAAGAAAGEAGAAASLADGDAEGDDEANTGAANASATSATVRRASVQTPRLARPVTTSRMYLLPPTRWCASLLGTAG